MTTPTTPTREVILVGISASSRVYLLEGNLIEDGKGRISEMCDTCNGSGFRREYAGIYDGICFPCNGAGHARWFDSMDAYKKVIARRERAAARRTAKKAITLEASVAQMREMESARRDKAAAAVLAEAARIAALPEVPSGKQIVTGSIVSVKRVDSDFGYHSSSVVKMLILDDRGFKVWGSMPRVIIDALLDRTDEPDTWMTAARDTRVTFTATLTPKENGFGFFSRPTKAEVL